MPPLSPPPEGRGGRAARALPFPATNGNPLLAHDQWEVRGGPRGAGAGLAPPSPPPPRGGRVTHVRASPRAVVRSLPRRLPLGGGARAACGAGTRAVVIGAGGGGRGRSGGRLSQGVL